MLDRRILFIDNDPDFLNTRAEFLTRAGYHVLKAQSPEQARQRLANTHVHLAIVDIRLTDDDDPRDTSGLALVHDPAFSQLPKIVLTGFPTYEAVLNAMAPKDGSPRAIDFVAKVDGPHAMIQSVEQVLAEHVPVNWDLDVQWDASRRLSSLYLTSLLQPGLPNDLLAQRADEFEDLLGRLFYEYRAVRLDRLLWHQGTRLCLSVLALSHQQATDRRLLVCGPREELSREVANARQLAPTVPRSTQLDNSAETTHLGAVTFILPETDIESVRVFGDVYRESSEGILKRAVRHLSKDLLAAWHRRGEAIETATDLLTLYRRRAGMEDRTQQWVDARVSALCQGIQSLGAVRIERDSSQVAFFFPNQKPLICADPVSSSYQSEAKPSTPVVCRISPGQLSSDNILVDSHQQTWLTDFSLAGQAPQWWDFVCLEALLRFQLCEAPDLLAWHEFEECLVAPASLSERLRPQDVIPDLRTSVVLIEEIRRQAGSETGVNPQPYYAGLLTWVVGAMARYDPSILYTREERMKSAHLVLAASMIAQRLNEPFHSTPAEGTMRIDDDGAVWIGDLKVSDLVGQELALLRCLSIAGGRVLSRQQVVEEVFDERYTGSPDQESRINTLVARLRKRIEPNPSQVRYVRTVRSQGYRLSIDG